MLPGLIMIRTIFRVFTPVSFATGDAALLFFNPVRLVAILIPALIHCVILSLILRLSVHHKLKVTGQPFHISFEFLSRIAAGDEAAFTEFFNFYHPLLRPFVSKFFIEPAATDEVLQETFIRVWLNRDKLPELDNVQAWLYTIASRQCLTALRKDLLHRKKREQWQKLEKESIENDKPDEMAILAEIKDLVAEAIRKMPPARQRIYRMSREEGLKPAQIAGELSLSVNTVKNVLVAALKEIRDYLSERGHLLPAVLFLLTNF